MKKVNEKFVSNIIKIVALLFLFFLSCMAISYILLNHYGKKLESFVSMSIQSFMSKPSTIQDQTKPLLDSYTTNSPPKLSNENAEDTSNYVPNTDMSSYSQITNNYRYWKSPNNGECIPTELCGSIYTSKNTNNNPQLNETKFTMKQWQNVDFSKPKVNLYSV